MPLRIDLAPGEKLYLGRSILVNGKTRIDFVLEGTGPALREKDYLCASTNHTLVEQLYFCVQQIYLELNAQDFRADHVGLVRRALDAGQLQSTDATALNAQIAAGAFYPALRVLKKLLPLRQKSSAAG